MSGTYDNFQNKNRLGMGFIWIFFFGVEDLMCFFSASVSVSVYVASCGCFMWIFCVCVCVGVCVHAPTCVCVCLFSTQKNGLQHYIQFLRVYCYISFFLCWRHFTQQRSKLLHYNLYFLLNFSKLCFTSRNQPKCNHSICDL
jgi:hypothetical protein